MAAWLAFLKSRLLLPTDPSDDGPTGEELSAILAFRLERLQAMRNAGSKLMARNQLGKEFFSRGIPENLEKKRTINYTLSLLDLMQGYARIRTRDDFRPFTADRENVFTIETALERMRKMLGFSGEWNDLMSFLPEEWQNEPKRVRAATAATFAATLELVKAGSVELRQSETFARIELRKRNSE
jgi:segregation and condensation protein A